MFCDQCGGRVDRDAAQCPHCGAALDPAPLIPAQRAGGQLLGSVPARLAALPPWRAWLGGIAGRNLRGVTAGIVGAWFGVPWILLAASLGAIIGGITGLVSGTFAGSGVLDRLSRFLDFALPIGVSPADLLPTAAAQIGGIVGAILGAANGAFELAWRAGVWPWQKLYAGDPLWPWAAAVGQVLTALAVGLLWVAASAVTERWRLRALSGARRPSRREQAWLGPILAEVAGRMGVKRPPVLLIDDRRQPNSYAAMRHLVIYQGLLDELGYDRTAVAGVLAHELAHWRNGDVVATTFAKGVALPLYLLHELAFRLVVATARVRPLQWLLRALLWSVLATMSWLVVPAQARMAQRNELRADRAAAEAGYGEGLRRALARLRVFETGRDGWDQAVCHTHPPTELRLELLEVPGRRYPLRDDYSLVAGLLGAPTSSVRRTD